MQPVKKFSIKKSGEKWVLTNEQTGKTYKKPFPTLDAIRDKVKELVAKSAKAKR